MNPLLLLDFDTTLFKTAEFWKDFAVVFAKFSGLPADTYIEHYHDYTKGEGKLLRVDYDTMLAHAHAAPATVRKAVREQITRQSYLFDDARELLKALAAIQERYDTAILTFGQPSFQQLKLDHALELADIPVYITQESKADYIRRYFADRPGGALVDDKPGQELPDRWIEIHIDRASEAYRPPHQTAPGVYDITDLQDVLPLL